MSTGEPRKPGGPPGPRGSLLLGSARALQRDQLGTYERAMHEHGEVARFRVGPPGVGFQFDAVFHPDGARQVLGTDARHYAKQAPVFTEIGRVIGDGLLTSDGERWRSHRRILQPLFTRQRVASYTPTIARAAEDLVASLRSGAEADPTVDLYGASMDYALDVVGGAIFGSDLHAAVPIVREALPVLNEHATRRGLAPARVPASWPTPANRRAARAQGALFTVVEDLLEQRRRTASDGEDLLSLLLTAADPETGATLQGRAARDHALTFLLAGHETTGSALAFTMHLLATHPEVQERVRDEVRVAIGDRSAASADLGSLRYTSAVVDEALRLYPPVHTLVRRTRDRTELRGHQLPPHRIVAVSIWGIHHNPAVWPQPERFDPDRFGGDGRPAGERYAHLPFGGGARSCIGAHFATVELVLAVAVVVRAFHLRSPQDLRVDAGLTLRPLGDLPCELERV